MTQLFSPEQSSEIDDRIVEMIVAILGEGDAAKRCRVIAIKRYLENVPQIDDPAPVCSEAGDHRPLPPKGNGVLSDADEPPAQPIHTEQAR